jgi:hypothetical protein
MANVWSVGDLAGAAAGGPQDASGENGVPEKGLPESGVPEDAASRRSRRSRGAGARTFSPLLGSTLTAGQSTQATISVSGLTSLDTALTLSPGGQHITVLLQTGLLG